MKTTYYGKLHQVMEELNKKSLYLHSFNDHWRGIGFTTKIDEKYYWRVKFYPDLKKYHIAKYEHKKPTVFDTVSNPQVYEQLIDADSENLTDTILNIIYNR